MLAAALTAVSLLTIVTASRADAMCNAPCHAAEMSNDRASYAQDRPVCLSVKGGGTANGTWVTDYQCLNDWNAHRDQYWWETDTGWTELVNSKSGKCLSVAGGGTANSTHVTISTCLGNADQWWYYLYSNYFGSGEWVNWKSGKCLDVAGGSTSNSIPTTIYTCFNSWDSHDDQWWAYPA